VLLAVVNILIYAPRAESPEHERYANWLRRLAPGIEPFGLSELGASAFVRIVTNTKI
jgi:predicted nucleic acid-binding protein